MVKIYNFIYPTTIEINKIDACIGNFDGIHLGHQYLINKTIQQSKIDKVESCVILFNPDVHNYFSQNHFQINTIEERIKKIIDLGIDNIIVIEFNDLVANLSKKEFIEEVLYKFNINCLLCGDDFTFGKNAEGKIDYLNEYFYTIIVNTIKYENKKISSSNIRDLIRNNELDKANTLLGK